MNRICLILCFTFGATIAQAHIDPGSHKGLAADGSACEMIVGDTTFENNQHHPLNERITIAVNGDTFVVGHPPMISVADKMAYFNHDQFQGVLPTKIGAKALVVTMEHSANFEGPTEFHLITHEYKADKREMLTCTLTK